MAQSSILSIEDKRRLLEPHSTEVANRSWNLTLYGKRKELVLSLPDSDIKLLDFSFEHSCKRSLNALTNNWVDIKTHQNLDCSNGHVNQHRMLQFMYSKEQGADNAYILLDVFGDKQTIPLELISFLKAIEEAKDLLSYEDDWDEEGACATDAKTFTNAMIFLTVHSSYVLRDLKHKLNPPYIDITRSGGIMLVWKAEKGKLTIIFNKGKDVDAYFYAEPSSGEPALRGGVRIGSKVNKPLAVWMGEYL